MIELDDISWSAPGFSLEGVSLNLPSGAYGVLMGKTGSGKTTLLEILCGLRRPDSGRVILGGKDVTGATPGDRGIGYVPQDGALFPAMRIGRQIGFGLRIRKRPDDEIDEKVSDIARELGVSHLLERTPDGLSGGEKQRVALARALILEPSVLLLDEPLASLDEGTRGDIVELLKRTHRAHGFTVLHVTHGRNEAESLGEVRLRLVEGRIENEVEAATPNP